MADTELNISPDEKVAGVPLARLLRNLDETSYNEGSVDLACRLTDCKAVIEELLQQRALASRPAEVDDEGLPPLPSPDVLNFGVRGYTAEQFRQGQRDAVAADRAQREKLPANADEMVAFIGGHYNSMRDDKPDPNDIVYELTVHDLLSAFRWWFDEFELEDEPSHTTNRDGA